MTKLDWQAAHERDQARLALFDRPNHSRLPSRRTALKDMPAWAKLAAPPCPRCKKPMQVRFRRSDGQRFFGCSGYPNCKKTIPIPKG